MNVLSQRALNFCKLIAPNYGDRGAGTKAAREAGWAKSSARQIACRLLKDPRIIKQIEIEQKLLAEAVDRKMSTQEVIDRYVDMARMTGDYGEASVTEAERALKQLGKYKSMQGFTDKLVIEHKIPFRDWSVEQIDDFIEKGIVPKGKRLPKVEGIGQIGSGGISEKSGAGNN